MIISKVLITNYRNFKSFEIDLKKLTLIIGENNIGKTNLLNALGLIFSQDISFYRKRTLEIEDINFNAINDFKADVIDANKPIKDIRFVEVKIEVELTNFVGNPKQEAVVADWLIDESLTTAKLTYHYSLREDLTEWITDIRNKGITSIDFPINKYEYIVYGGLDETKQVDFYFLKMLKFEFLDALRDAKTQLIASGDYRLLYKVLTNLGEGKFEDIKVVLKALKDEVDKNPTLTNLKTEISTFLEKTSLVENEDFNKVDFEFTKIEENEILKKLSLVYGNAPITVERNGLGRNNILFISLILSHLISINDNTNCFRIIAIEEPEAHLHPHLQEHLAKNIQRLTNDSLQIIITSHSTHITSKLDLENTVVVFNDQEKGLISNHYILNNFANANGKIDADAQHSIRYLSRFLDATKSTMFFARKIIFVEGIAEQTLLPIFFERTYGRSLEKEGISVVNVNGVSFEHFLKILKNGYFIKSLVLTDSDINTKQRKRAENLQEDFKDYKNIVDIQKTNTPTFEIEIIEENKNDENSRVTILEAIKLTRPNSGNKDFADAFNKSLDTGAFFHLIEPKNDKGEKTGDYKSEFATNLSEILYNEDNEFNVPKYILDGFNFLIPAKDGSN
ncbi:ATP-dependent nuclease [Flavobacterium sp. GCM10027622]|uniref:ATP-dependent nuclease n=1 Tax=unclassified Flavobacterium TaxID=196869 RepID=UPI00360D6F20